MSDQRQDLSIILADDHPVVLHGLAGILRAQPDLHVVELCNGGAAAVDAVRKHNPDLAVLDISMPEISGLDVLSAIVADGLTTKFIFLTASANDLQILTGIARGAKGIMLKD